MTKLSNMLSVDVEDWCQSTLNHNMPITSRAVKNTHEMLDIFSQTKTKATFFILGKVAEKYPELVKKIAAEGHEIASHGYGHIPLFEITPEQFREDLRRSHALLQDITGHEVVGYRAPDFSITEKSLWALDILREEKFLYDSSIFPITNSRYGIPGWPREIHQIQDSFFEVPVSTIRCMNTVIPFGGGGYFRLYPYWLIRLGIKHLNRSHTPVVIYTHPYEVDAEELKGLKGIVPLKLRMTQGLNRKHTRKKLCKMMNDFQFIPIKEGLRLYGKR